MQRSVLSSSPTFLWNSMSSENIYQNVWRQNPDEFSCQYVYLPTRRNVMWICISSYQATFYFNMCIFLRDEIVCQYVYLPARRHFMLICISSYQMTFCVNMYIYQTTFYVSMYIFLPDDILCQYVYLPTRRYFMSICNIFLKEFRTHKKIVLNFTILRQWNGRRNSVEIGFPNSRVQTGFSVEFLRESWWSVRLDRLPAFYVTSCSVKDRFRKNLLLLSLCYNILITCVWRRTTHPKRSTYFHRITDVIN